MPGNGTVERWLDNIKSDHGRSTVRGEDNQYRHTDRRDESVNPYFGKPPQDLHIGSTSKHRAKPHGSQKISQDVLPPQNENYSNSRSRAKPRGNKGPLSLQRLPVSGNSSRSPYSEAAPQSYLSRSYSASVYGSYTSRPVPYRSIISPEIAPVSYATTFSVTKPQQASASVASYQHTYVNPTLNHTVQQSSSFPPQSRHRDISEGSVQITVAQETQRVGFRTAEGDGAYGR